MYLINKTVKLAETITPKSNTRNKRKATKRTFIFLNTPLLPLSEL